jgi:hypothetical protein
MQNKNIIIYVATFLILLFGSYFAFGYLFPISSQIDSQIATDSISGSKKQTGVLDFAGPKTAVCPINGELFTTEEQKIWETRRPLLVMIENHSESRPQSGLNNADIVYESNSEGGITRFMGVFYCNAVKGATNKYDVGPVRSARTYFLDLASEYSDYPLYAHVGGSNCSAPKDPVTGRQSGPCTTNKKAQALEQISDYGWNNKGTWGDLSQFSLSYKACRREEDRTGVVKATEHTMYCSSTELWNVAASRGLTNQTEINKTLWNKNFKTWSFKQVDQPATTIDAKTISFDWWGDKAYGVTWTYDSATKQYLRQNGGEVAIDFNTKEQLNAKNIIIEWTKETRSIDEHLHNLYAVVGTGEAVLLQNGTKTDITWSKPNRTARTIYKDKSGKEINLIPGRTWIEILPLGNKVIYES